MRLRWYTDWLPDLSNVIGQANGRLLFSRRLDEGTTAWSLNLSNGRVTDWGVFPHFFANTRPLLGALAVCFESSPGWLLFPDDGGAPRIEQRFSSPGFFAKSESDRIIAFRTRADESGASELVRLDSDGSILERRTIGYSAPGTIRPAVARYPGADLTTALQDFYLHWRDDTVEIVPWNSSEAIALAEFKAHTYFLARAGNIAVVSEYGRGTLFLDLTDGSISRPNFSGRLDVLAGGYVSTGKPGDVTDGDSFQIRRLEPGLPEVCAVVAGKDFSNRDRVSKAVDPDASLLLASVRDGKGLVRNWETGFSATIEWRPSLGVTRYLGDGAFLAECWKIGAGGASLTRYVCFDQVAEPPYDVEFPFAPTEQERRHQQRRGMMY